MLFNSYLFIFAFLPVTIIGFATLGQRSKRAAIGWLTLTSLIFYGYWNPPYVLVLIGSILANYLIGRAISREGGKTKWRVILGVLLNLGLLFYYKYTNFFLDNVAEMTGADWELGTILLPIGISFYTFTQIAYLIDCQRGFVREYNLLDYALFVSFFPQLIAGPILHHKEMMPQFDQPETYRIGSSNLAIGATIFIFGLFKKAVLADGIAVYATPLFVGADSGLNPDFFAAWGGALAYTFQLYFDFSGYSDMAIGLARMFGIVLPLNFASPYKSRNIVEFWRTWHMTLSRFLRDYLYISLGGNRKGNVRRYINLFLTMLLGGIWHGAGWNFAIWGALHGIYLMINHAWSGSIGRVLGPGRLVTFGAWAITFLAVVIGWVFFRAVTLDGALNVVSGMAGMNGIALPSAITARLGGLTDIFPISTGEGGGAAFVSQWLWIIALFLISVFAPNTQEIMRKTDPALDFDGTLVRSRITWRPTFGWAMITALLGLISILALTRVSEFLYFQF
ncbi:MBOAT family protein [Pacificimonas sp. WHA3]|uniref:Probable alginate O-acetylase AlgI n=1 Tax=Pacificimonas pallii TaxID=2827236 RepID=A0ABS6SDG3_9SPHN|nr:MBOAT family protein [Pacificimonas pallii]MBV7256290.1 MBOAT family protein [Pacificimonas pallii]